MNFNVASQNTGEQSRDNHFSVSEISFKLFVGGPFKKIGTKKKVGGICMFHVRALAHKIVYTLDEKLSAF